MLLLAALMVAALPMVAQQVKYSVKGSSPKDGEKVYLSWQDGPRSTVIDSTVVVSGQFAFEGEQQKEAIMHFVSRNAMNIQGLGDSFVDAFMKLVKSPAEELKSFFDRLKVISEAHHVDFVISASIDDAVAPDFLREYYI